MLDGLAHALRRLKVAPLLDAMQAADKLCGLDPKFLSYPVAGMSGCEKFDGISAGGA